MDKISTTVVAHYKSIFPNYTAWMSNTIMTKVEIIPIQYYPPVKTPMNLFRLVHDISRVCPMFMVRPLSHLLEHRWQHCQQWIMVQFIFPVNFLLLLLLLLFFVHWLIRSSAPTATTMLNSSQLAQQYTTALACPTSSGAATLLTSSNATSPYIFLSTSTPTSDEVCANPTGLAGTDLTGKNASLSSPSTLYFYNNNSTPTMYPTEFLRLWYLDWFAGGARWDTSSSSSFLY